MPNLFNSVPVYKKGRNKFNLSFVNTFSVDYGLIYPVMVKEAIPSDIWKMSVESFVRAQPLACPAFIRSDVSYHFFFVPNRLVYEDWTKFIVRGKDGDTDYDKPFVRIRDLYSITTDYHYFAYGSLMDYLNFPSMSQNSYNNSNDTPVDMMTFNAYSLIYNEYYRDENLIPEVFIWKKSGVSLNLTDYQSYRSQIREDYNLTNAQANYLVFPTFLRRRSWRKDYFTSALPFVQKGTPISLFANHNNSQDLQVVKWMLTGQGTDQEFSTVEWFNPDNPQASTNGQLVTYHEGGVTHGIVGYLTNAQLQGDSMTISDLRTAMAIQQWFELNARTGSDRYFEYLLGHFAVRDRDARLQRPEYLGGFSHEIQVSEVEQNSETSSNSPQGNLAGKALGYSINRPIKFKIPEWGFIMCLCSVRPRTPYYQGLPRMYQRWDAFDYYDPLFDHLSERSIGISELTYDWSYDPQSGSNDLDFGYTPIWSEYRSSLDELHGDFRASLSYWVSPRKDLDNALLNQDFIEINPYSQNLNDAFAYAGTASRPVDHFLFHCKFNISVIRPMSKFGTPKL